MFDCAPTVLMFPTSSIHLMDFANDRAVHSPPSRLRARSYQQASDANCVFAENDDRTACQIVSNYLKVVGQESRLLVGTPIAGAADKWMRAAFWARQVLRSSCRIGGRKLRVECC